MANVYAVKSGNWSDTTVWNTGALPTSADDVYANNFTVTIDTSPTVLSIRNAATTGVTAGGWFVPTNGITLTCAGSGVLTSQANQVAAVFQSSLAAGQSCAIIGSITGGVNNNPGAINSSGGTLTITGNVTGGIGNASSEGVRNTSTGTVVITGNVTGGGVTAHGANNTSTGTITITGTCLGGSSTGSGANNASTGTLSHVGTVQAGTGSPGISGGSATQTTILTGPFLTSTNGLAPVTATRWVWANNPVATRYEIRTANLATIRPLYTADSVGGNPAASNVRSGTVYGPNSELTGTCAVPGASSVLSGVPVDATTGTATISAADIRAAMGLASANLDAQFAAIPAAPSATAIRTELDSNSTKLANLDATVSSRSTYAGGDTSGTTTLLSRLTSTRAGYLDNISTAAPSAADIATAVWAAGTRTLTTTIASASDIASAVWSAVTRTLTSNAAPSAADVATAVRSELGTELGRIDANVSSRLAGSSYSAPPSAATNASAVRTELAPELSNLDATVSSRLAPSGTLARVTLTDTVTTLTNAPDVPTEAEIADAVRTELTPELARVSNAATTQEVADIVEGAVGD